MRKVAASVYAENNGKGQRCKSQNIGHIIIHNYSTSLYSYCTRIVPAIALYSHLPGALSGGLTESVARVLAEPESKPMRVDVAREPRVASAEADADADADEVPPTRMYVRSAARSWFCSPRPRPRPRPRLHSVASTAFAFAMAHASRFRSESPPTPTPPTPTRSSLSRSRVRQRQQRQ